MCDSDANQSEAASLGEKLTMKTITAKAKAFSSEPVKTHTFAIDADGTVRVWDSVACHYTSCHSLSKSAIIRIRKIAAAN